MDTDPATHDDAAQLAEIDHLATQIATAAGDQPAAIARIMTRTLRRS